jgi:triacylglycerol lipase
MKSFYYLLSYILMSAIGCKEPAAKKKQDELKIIDADAVFTEKNACLFSQIAYCKDIPAALTAYMPGWNTAWEATEFGGNHAFVAGNGTAYVLAIRGSLINFSWAAFQNWIYQDLHVTSQEKWAFTNDSSKAKLSQGSYDGWQNLKQLKDKKTGQLLLPFLKTAIKNGVPLLVTGHSLGGNLATVYASYLWQEYKNTNNTAPAINVITFAAPAAGNLAFANDFNKKFPRSIRVENENDIVPKFPSSAGISALSNLFTDSLSAGKIMVGYKNLTVSLSTVFSLINTAMSLLEFTSGISSYIQTNGEGKKIPIPLSGINTGNEIINWLSEAGHQHSIKQYAQYEGVPVVNCTE